MVTRDTACGRLSDRSHALQVDQGVDGICILANYSKQFLLSDEECKT